MMCQAADTPLSTFNDEWPATSVNIRPRARELVELSRMNTRWAMGFPLFHYYSDLAYI